MNIGYAARMKSDPTDMTVASSVENHQYERGRLTSLG